MVYIALLAPPAGASGYIAMRIAMCARQLLITAEDES